MQLPDPASDEDGQRDDSYPDRARRQRRDGKSSDRRDKTPEAI
ncbi:hypothetical protein ACX9NE_12870 [Mycobacterium sp. ML4]